MSVITSTPISADQLAEFESASKRMRLMLTSQSLITNDGKLNTDQAPLPSLDLWLRLARSKSEDFKKWSDIPKHIRPFFTLDGYQAADIEAPVVSLLVRPTGYKLTEGDVRNIIARFGPVRDVYCPINVVSGRQRPFTFVEIIGHEAAASAIEAFSANTIMIGGHKIYVELATHGRKTPNEMRSRF